MNQEAENLRRIQERLALYRAAAQREAEQRKKEIYQICPEMQQIDRALQNLGLELFQAACGGREGLSQRIAKVRSTNEALLQDRAEILRALGKSPDYLKPHYRCSLCEDTGYVDGKRCICLKKALILEGFEHSGLGTLLQTQSFETFDLSYYQGENRLRMEQNLAICRAYAASFSPKQSGSLLLYGPTGLGKTHLSTSIARQVIEQGYDVCYVTATELFSVYENARFAHDASATPTQRYATCDLLILDDLGTEATTQYSVSCLYDLLNIRMNRSLPWIINTNLFDDDLQKKYQDRIVSRLFGASRPLLFSGKDVRFLRLQHTPQNPPEKR